jgi:RNA polymerase-binding transcription factor DksA
MAKKATNSKSQKEKPKKTTSSKTGKKEEKKSAAKKNKKEKAEEKENKKTAAKNTQKVTADKKKSGKTPTKKETKSQEKETKKKPKTKKAKLEEEDEELMDDLELDPVDDEDEEDSDEVNVDIDPSILVGDDLAVDDDDDDDDYVPRKPNPTMIKGKVRPLFEEKKIPQPKWSPPKEEIRKPVKAFEDNRVRYSDEELAEFKEIILKKLEEARQNYKELKDALTHSSDHGTDDTHATFKLMEDGSETMTREEIAQLAARQEKFIKNLEAALVRIENKTYGICRVTGKLIPKERLRLVPHATLSIEAKEKLNR